jgi:ketosteroid isomerase-like protein
MPEPDETAGAASELVRRAFDAFERRDLSELVELLDPAVEFLPVTANITTGGVPYRGHEGIALYLDDVTRVWTELRVFPDELREIGDIVVALGRVHGRGGGMIIDRPSGWVWRIRDGRVVWWRVFASHEEALEAATALTGRPVTKGDG